MSGYRLKACRTDRGYTQQQIADVLGVTRTAYVHMETGRNEVAADYVMKLADFYDCPTDELLGSRYYYEYVSLDGAK